MFGELFGQISFFRFPKSVIMSLANSIFYSIKVYIYSFGAFFCTLLLTIPSTLLLAIPSPLVLCVYMCVAGGRWSIPSRVVMIS